MIRFRTLAAAVLLVLAAPAGAQELTVTLSPPAQTVKRGDAPRFEVVVRAAERRKVLDVVRREDLKDKLAKPKIWGGKDLDDIPVSLLALGPVGEGDYLVLEPNDTIRFEHRGLPLVLGRLQPGNYVIAIRYAKDWSTLPVQSNRVNLKVIP